MTKANYDRIRTFMLAFRNWKREVWLWKYMGMSYDLPEKPKY